MTGNILIISDDPTIVPCIKDHLNHDGHTVITTSDEEAGRRLFNAGQFDVVITEDTEAGTACSDTTHAIKASDPTVELIVMIRNGSEELVKAALRNGADDFLVVPDELSYRLRPMLLRALEKRHLVSEKQALVLRIEKQDEEQDKRQMRQSQKMETLGRMAGGIAHDFNNLLSIMNANAFMIQGKFQPEDPLYQNAKQIQDAGDRAAELVKQLLAFNESHTMKLARMHLNEVISNLNPMMQQSIHERIQLDIDLAPSTDQVLMDRTQLEQVIMNLVVNARDAMTDGGVLSLRTKTVNLSEQEACVFGLPANTYVRLDVQDTGHGMDESVQARIFDPFFTTKEKDKGNGLGLATVYGIVKQSAGTILVSSAPGRGATFSIYLPVLKVKARHPVQNTEPVTIPEDRADHSAQTILVVDDDPTALDYMRKLLERVGYSVLEASNGSEALEQIDRHPHAIHLVVTDLCMPKMNGNQFVKQLRQSHPEMKAVFITGVFDPKHPKEQGIDETIPLLSKPFGMDTLLRFIREALDAPAHKPADQAMVS